MATNFPTGSFPLAAGTKQRRPGVLGYAPGAWRYRSNRHRGGGSVLRVPTVAKTPFPDSLIAPSHPPIASRSLTLHTQRFTCGIESQPLPSWP
jgi:hypothetical protein